MKGGGLLQGRHGREKSVSAAPPGHRRRTIMGPTAWWLPIMAFITAWPRTPNRRTMAMTFPGVTSHRDVTRRHRSPSAQCHRCRRAPGSRLPNAASSQGAVAPPPARDACTGIHNIMMLAGGWHQAAVLPSVDGWHPGWRWHLPSCRRSPTWRFCARRRQQPAEWLMRRRDSTPATSRAGQAVLPRRRRLTKGCSVAARTRP